MSLEGKSPEEIKALATLADSVLANPKTRGVFQRTVRAANPDVSFPEIDLEDKVAGALKPLQDKLAKTEAEREAERQQNAAQAFYQEIRDAGIVSNKTEFNELVTYASKTGFATDKNGLALAKNHREAEAQSAEPTPMNAGASLIPKGENGKAIFKDPNAWARQAAADAIKDIEKGRRNPNGRAAA